MFAFRFNKDENKFDFLGKYSFTKEEGMTEQALIEKATALRSPFDQTAALGAITALHSSYEGLAPSSVSLTQLGDEVRGSIVILKDDSLNRFLVATSASSSSESSTESPKYKVIEECIIEKIKPTHTETKVTVTGEKMSITNDIEKIVKEDKVVKELINSVKKDHPENKEDKPILVQTVEYEKKSEYVLHFEKEPTPETEDK